MKAILRTLITLACFSLIAADDAELHSELLGDLTFPNTGKAEAQMPFLKGVAALHSFWYDEAAELFRQAQEIDPNFVMAYWGEAMTHNHPLWRQLDRDEALEVLNKLAPTPEARQAKTTDEKEKAWLRTAEVLYAEGDRKDRVKAWSKSLHEMSLRWPNDHEVMTNYALSVMCLADSDERDYTRNRMRCAAICEPIYDQNPKHPGVLHYLIHAYDDPVHAPLGLPYANLYAKTAPSANHALHMPSHIFVQLGMWDRVVDSNHDAFQSSINWVKRRKHSISKYDYHSFGWLLYGYLQQGRFQKARDVMGEMKSLLKKEDTRTMRGAYKAMNARYIVETGNYKHPYDLKKMEDLFPSGATGSSVFAIGLAAVNNEDFETANTCLERLEKSSGEEGSSAWKRISAQVDGIMALELKGLIAWKKGRLTVALDHLRQAAEKELEHPAPSGPVDPLKPALELYGEFLLETGDAEHALAQFEESLLRTPRRPASLLGMARAYKALDQKQQSLEMYRELEKVWAQADKDHPHLAEVRAALK